MCSVYRPRGAVRPTWRAGSPRDDGSAPREPATPVPAVRARAVAGDPAGGGPRRLSASAAAPRGAGPVAAGPGRLAGARRSDGRDRLSRAGPRVSCPPPRAGLHGAGTVLVRDRDGRDHGAPADPDRG